MAGNKVKLQEFKSWNFEEFGFKILKENGISYVNYVWCKICAKNKECINKFPLSKAHLKMLRNFTDGTNYVTKYMVRILLQITVYFKLWRIFFIVILYSKKNVSFACMFLLLLPSFLRKNFEKIAVIFSQNNIHGRSIFVNHFKISVNEKFWKMNKKNVWACHGLCIVI